VYWDKLLKNKKFNLSDFRNTRKNNIFANWNPYKRGLTYHNYLIYNFINLFPKKEFLKFHKRLGNTNIGNPPGIMFSKRKVTFDDCWSVEELFFLKDKIRKNSNILEIGPGYGRTAHAIINSFDIKVYFVIDLKLTLKLTKKYLKKVLSKKNFEKVKFICFEDFDFNQNKFDKMISYSLEKKNKFKKFDLILNIDSFGEMEPFLIKRYLNFFENITKNFYFKNTVAKYKPCDLVDHLNGKKIPPAYNLKLNLQKKVINVFDDVKIKKYSYKTATLYNPNRKKFNFILKTSQLINYYCQSFYFLKKN
jgi:putative sugar O-methyltransferase